MGNIDQIELLYEDEKTRVIGSERRLKIYEDLLKYLDRDKWEHGKPVKYYIVEFKGKKCILIQPLL